MKKRSFRVCLKAKLSVVTQCLRSLKIQEISFKAITITFSKQKYQDILPRNRRNIHEISEVNTIIVMLHYFSAVN